MTTQTTVTTKKAASEIWKEYLECCRQIDVLENKKMETFELWKKAEAEEIIIDIKKRIK